jgi:glycosyltransferase 2 family protein
LGTSTLQDQTAGGAIALSSETPSAQERLEDSDELAQTDPQGGLRLGRPGDWAVGSLVLAALIGVVQYSVGWGALLKPWSQFSLGLIAWLFFLAALSYAVRAVRLYEWFRPRFKGLFLPLLRLTVLHNSANNLLPMRTGELVFPWLMKRYFGHGFFDAAAALLWIRILDMHFLGLVALFVLYLRQPSWIWWMLAMLWLAGLSILALIGRLGISSRLDGPGRVRKVARLVAGAAPHNPALIARVYFWTAVTWGLKFVAFASVLHHFVPVAFWRVIAGVMGAELSSILPIHGIAGSGSYEFAAVAALVPLGVDAKQALAGAVNLHLFLLGTTVLLGALGFLLPKPHDQKNGESA